jgi:hypothetical protein
MGRSPHDVAHPGIHGDPQPLVDPTLTTPIHPESSMTKAVLCLATNQIQAQGITSSLRQSGFSSNDISVLFPDRAGTITATDKQTKAPEGAVAGVGTGGAIGGAVGWMIAIGALAIPGAGPFIAAGPIMGLLAGVTVGAAVGGIAGALVGLGIPENDAKRYAGKVKAGSVMILVHTDDSAEIEKAKQVFRDAKAEDIITTADGVAVANPPKRAVDSRKSTTVADTAAKAASAKSV